MLLYGYFLRFKIKREITSPTRAHRQILLYLAILHTPNPELCWKSLLSILGSKCLVRRHSEHVKWRNFSHMPKKNNILLMFPEFHICEGFIFWGFYFLSAGMKHRLLSEDVGFDPGIASSRGLGSVPAWHLSLPFLSIPLLLPVSSSSHVNTHFSLPQ